MARPPIVFAGPSIGREEILAIVPDAEVRRPVRRGDLDGIDGETVVAIIDGVFDAELAVSPREIRKALGRGVRIVGSSSMGALRAVEVPEMLGVGRVYESYRDGTTRRDDEVAILLDNESGRALTEPLVNIRFAVGRLVSAGRLAADIGETIVATALAMHFHDRTYRNVLRQAAIASSDIDKLVSALRSFDLKREDAMSLLERLEALGTDPHWDRLRASGFRAVDDERAEYEDELDAVQIAAEVPADAPVVVWEYGETIDFSLLLRFLAATGRFDEYARNAVLRFLLDDGSVPAPEVPPRVGSPSAQDLIDGTATDWGWETPGEVHVTLRDLGVGLADLEARYAEAYEARRRLVALYESMPEALLRTLRFELLTNDLALKRETMRLGALQALAADSTAVPTALEREEARVALAASAFHHRPVVQEWAHVLADAGRTPDEVADVVDLVARARRRGVELLEAMEHGQADPAAPLPGVDALPPAAYVGHGHRSVADADALVIVEEIGRKIGVTRVAQIGELARIGGLHVASAYRPSIWSSSVGAGKSESLEGALVGAVMEELEAWCQERFVPDEVRRAAFGDLSAVEAVDPRELSLPFDSTYDPARPIEWSWATDLVSGKKLLVPSSALAPKRLPNDIFFSQRLARKMFSTNGLASGLTVTEAVAHALAERIERHAVKLAEQDTTNPGGMPSGPTYAFVDIATCPPSTRRICEKLARDGDYTIRVLDITSDIRIPTFIAEISSVRGSRLQVERLAQGMCAHPSAENAINRAILEAVQCVLTSVAGAREDMTLNVQSLGRHERPRPNARATAAWIRPWIAKRPFRVNPGVVHGSGRDDVRAMVAALVAASYSRVLYRDLSFEETAPGAAVRVLVPGTEDVNPLHTGRRARAAAIRDLLRRFEPV